MKCQDIHKLLLDEINGELDRGQKTALQAHLDQCPDCRKLADEYRRTIANCRAALNRDQAPQQLSEEAVAGLLAQAEAIPQVRKSRLKHILAAAAVFALLIAVATSVLPPLGSSRNQVCDQKAAAMPDGQSQETWAAAGNAAAEPLPAAAPAAPLLTTAPAALNVADKAPARPQPAATPRAMNAPQIIAALDESNAARPAKAKVKTAAAKGNADNKLQFADADQLKKADARADVKREEAESILLPVSPLALTETAGNPLSTFSIDTDNTSFVLTRDLLRQGVKPDGTLIKPEEFINFFDYNYPEPAPGEVLSCTATLFKNPFRPGRCELVIGVQAENSGVKAGGQTNFELIVDASGSMALNNRWTPAVQCVDMLRQKLGPNDRMTVIYSHDGEKKPGGQSKIIEQLEKARHDLENFKIDGRRRIIILTDGDELPPSPETETRTLADAEALRNLGAPVTVIGFGQFQNPQFWEKIAERSGGSLVYVDSTEEVERIFSQEFDRRFQTVADDVKIQVEFNPGAVKAYRLVGYRERLMRAEDFRNDKVRASPVGPGQEATANYELELTDTVRPESVVAKIFVRYRPQHGFGFEEREFTVLTKDLHTNPGTVPADAILAFAAGEFAEALKYPNTENIAQPAGIIAILPTTHAKNAQLLELLNLAK